MVSIKARLEFICDYWKALLDVYTVVHKLFCPFDKLINQVTCKVLNIYFSVGYKSFLRLSVFCINYNFKPGLGLSYVFFNLN